MRRVSASALVLSLLATTSAARADWQFTKWDMSRDQLLESAKDNAHAVTGRSGQRVWNLDLGAEGSYSEGGFVFKSEYYFDKTMRLKAVRLEPVDQSRCDDVKTWIEGVHGAPVERKSILADFDSSEYWRKDDTGDFVRFNIFLRPQFCFIAYAPLSSVDAEGVPHFD